MEQCIGCDAHKKFSVFVSLNEHGEYGPARRVGHEWEEFRRYLQGLPAHSHIALETGGSYYWLVDEMTAAGHIPHLAHAFTARRRVGGRHKTNERDARGLALLLRNETLPEVWIPPASLRDEREMLRWRMRLSHMGAQLKNRIQGLLQLYNVPIACSDLFGDKGRLELLSRMEELPQWTRASMLEQLTTVDALATRQTECEQMLESILVSSAERDLLRTKPGVGKILSAVEALEIGDIRRFPTSGDLASYAGTVGSAYNTGDYTQQLGCGRDCNHYLNWAYVEAANVIAQCRDHENWRQRHVVQLYKRVRDRTHLHGKATMAVARHLAESSYSMLKKQEIYKEPRSKRQVLSSTHG
jgi:transposase